MPRGGKEAAVASGPRCSWGGEDAGRCLPQDAEGGREGGRKEGKEGGREARIREEAGVCPPR